MNELPKPAPIDTETLAKMEADLYAKIYVALVGKMDVREVKNRAKNAALNLREFLKSEGYID